MTLNRNNEEQLPTMKLSHLPLRPSTLSLLTRKGFHSTADVRSSKAATGGGISNFASELEIPLVDAVCIGREVEDAVRSMMPSDTSTGNTISSGNGGSTSTGNMYTSRNTNTNNTTTLNVYQRRNVDGGSGNHHQHQNQQAYSNSNSNQRKRRAPQTAAAILSSHYNEPMSFRPIISFVRSIDSLLGGGFHPKEVIEVAGLPGVGKTQLAMQLCVDAHLPKQFGGTGGESIYIDSEGSFSPERCLDMAKALVDHVHNSARRSMSNKKQKQRTNNGHSNSNSNSQTQKVVPPNFTPESILDTIHVFRVYDETCQSATILSLPSFLSEMKQKGRMVKVLVIDSIAFHYRCSSSDYKSRTKSLTSTAAFLSDLANTFDLSIIVINQMTTKIGGNSSNSHGSNNDTATNVAPALGESWAHSTSTRILLMFEGGTSSITTHNSHGDEYGIQGQRRICKLVKSPHKASGLAYFSVTEFGLRDCVQ